MTIDGEHLPPMRTVLGELDRSARSTAQAAGRQTVSAVRAILPARTQTLRRGTRARVRRTQTGYEVDVAPRKTPAYASGVTPIQVAQWVEEGTGVYRGGRRIRPRRGSVFHLPHGWADSIKGQRAQRPFARAQTSEEAAVTQTLKAGADVAAAAMERVIGGGR